MECNIKRYTLLVIVFLAALFCCISAANASHIVPVDEIPAQEAEEYKQRLSMSVSEIKPEDLPFSCFDVRGDGKIAVQFRSYFNDRRMVAVFTSSAEFCYAIEIDTPGTVHIEWGDDGNLRVFLIRGSIVATVNELGECIAVQKIDVFDNPQYMCYSATEKTDADGNRYIAKNDTGFPNLSGVFSKIIKVDKAGAEQVLYDATNLHRRQAIMTLTIAVFCVAAFFGVLISVVYNIFKPKLSNH